MANIQVYYKVTYDENNMVVQVESASTEGDGFVYLTPAQVKLLERYGTTKEKLEAAAS